MLIDVLSCWGGRREPSPGRDGFLAGSKPDRAGPQAGDTDAFSALCRIHGTRLLRQATLLCGDPVLAEDLAQETLVAAWRNLRRFHGRCQIFTWFCAILLNQHRNFRRRRIPIPLGRLELDHQESAKILLEAMQDGGMRPDQVAANKERSAALRRCIEKLPTKHREVIHLRFYVDDSLEGIAAALGCSVGTVKSRLFNALERLRVASSHLESDD